MKKKSRRGLLLNLVQAPFVEKIIKLSDSYLNLFFIAIIIFNLFVASWYVLNQDIYMHTDIARDFLIFAEIMEKKLVLIGARAGGAGLFHGPLWYYLNFPVWFFSSGNPVIVGWFWVIFMIIIMLLGYVITKHLFDRKTAIVFLILISNYLMFQTNSFSHQHLSMLIMLLYFITFYKYIKSLKIKFLILHVISAGFLIQAELAAGIPFFILSFIYIFYFLYKNKKINHLLAYLTAIFPLLTFIVFDIRHDFIQFKSYLAYTIPSPGEGYVGIISIIKNRIDYMSSAGFPLAFGRADLGRVFFVIFLFAVYKKFRAENKNKLYFAFIYLFFGYFIFSLTSRYYLLLQHFMAFIPIVFIFFSAFVYSKYKHIFLPILIISIILNTFVAINFISKSNDFTGKHEDSWKSLREISDDVFSENQSEFGYFVYSPDKLAYEPKYLMKYGELSNPNKKAHYFEKKAVTYIVSAPPPPNEPWMNKDNWWTINSIHIDNEPSKTIHYPNGYQVDRFELSAEEIAIPWDQFEDNGIHFR